MATTFVANLRYSLFATSLVPLVKDAPPRASLPRAHGVADGSYALTLVHALRHPERPRKDRYLLGSFLVGFCAWVPSTIAEALLGSSLPALSSTDLARGVRRDRRARGAAAGGHLKLSFSNLYVYAALAAVTAASLSRNLLATILAGVGGAILLKQVFGYMVDGTRSPASGRSRSREIVASTILV